MLTAADGVAIARKLNATSSEGKRHTRVIVELEGRIVGKYGIQRSTREKSHDYIARQIHLTGRQARDLANCPMSREEYITSLRERGLL